MGQVFFYEGNLLESFESISLFSCRCNSPDFQKKKEEEKEEKNRAKSFLIGALAVTGAVCLISLIGSFVAFMKQRSKAPSDIEKAEGYLAHKWGLEGNLPDDHPYKNSAPTN